MEEAIKADIVRLRQLQDVDSKIDGLEAKIAEIPEHLQALRQGLDEEEARVAVLKDEIKNIEVEKNDKEITLQIGEEKIEKLERQLYQMKSNKEYTAMQSEIAGVKADNSLSEEEVLTLLESIDEKNEELQMVYREIEKKKKELTSEEDVLNEEKKTLEEELARFKAWREKTAAGIDAVLTSEYERVRKGRDGVGIIRLESGVCQGCFMMVPPQVVNELHLGSRVVKCENCSRILYEGDE